MSLQKTDLLGIGQGNIRDNAQTCIVYSSNIAVAQWNAAVTYAAGNVVELSNIVYRSLTSNINSTPASNPTDWEVLYSGAKDGDVAIIVNGTSSSIMQRANSLWVSIVDSPLSVSLIDGQLTPATAVTFLGSSRNYAKFEYTLKRGAGEGRKRKGIMNILNDSISAIEYDHEFNEIGADVNVTLTPVMSGSNVNINYTSVAESVTITLKFVLKGWT